MATVQDTIEAAGPEILGMIVAGRAALRKEEERRLAEERRHLEEGERLADLHWGSLQRAVEMLLPKCLWRYCNSHGEIRPDGMANWRDWNDGCWDVCNTFTLKINAPGCVEIIGSLAHVNDHTSVGWNHVRSKTSKSGYASFGMWVVKHHEIGKDDDDVFHVHERCGEAACADDLSVALAYAAEGYEYRNKMYQECEAKNKEREQHRKFTDEVKRTMRPPAKTTEERLLEVLKEFVYKHAPDSPLED